jgi:nucleotide-binding universal stress UspA family protein
MAFKDVLLPLNSYPEPTPLSAIEQAIGFAGALGAHISALTFRVEIPNVGNALANTLLDISGMVAAERQKSEANTQSLIAAFEAVATKHGVAHDQIVESRPTSQMAAVVAEHARMHDLTMIPVGEPAEIMGYVAETVIFGSGRPTIVFPQVPKRGGPSSFDVVGIAWDFSRPAARAVADALPILQRAKTVRVVTVTKEKTIDTRRSASDLARNLAHHGVEAILEEEDAAGRSIGQALEGYVTGRGIDLLVMGAYGHSRMRDFIMGGATKALVADPPVPVLLSH